MNHDYGRLLRLDGQVALVTGAARGIGAEVARALGQAGARVLVTDLDPAADALLQSLGEAGIEAAYQRHDVTDETQWEAAVAACLARFGGLDVLVNNAGIENAGLITQTRLEDFERLMKVNVSGVFLGLKHALRAMGPGGAAGRGGSIVNLSSVAGLIGTSAHIAYHASKGAVRLMTKAAAIECAQLGLGVRVNSVHPGIVETQMGTRFIQDFVDLGLAPDYPSAEASIRALHPGGFGRTPDVAAAVLYLATPASRWVNGSELVVDGGLTAA